MKLLTLLIAYLTVALVIAEPKDDCKHSGDDVKGIEECNETEYQSYVECVRRRMKRDTNCNKTEACTDCQESTCEQCDCDFCAVNVCDSSCDDCCADNPPCKNKRCCHKTCHSRCKTISCRTDCRRNCIEKVAVTQENVESNPAVVIDKPRHNVTTIIDIHNVINTTNEIEIPIQVNNTNFNNFTLDNLDGSSKTQAASNVQESAEPCCQIISPRQCVPKQEYPFVRCFHLRKKACGSFCKAPTLLEQSHEICDETTNGTNCQQQLVYVPQAQQSCSFQPVWPYVNCGGTQNNVAPLTQSPPQYQQTGCAGGDCYNGMNTWGGYYPPQSFYGQPYAPAVPNFQGPFAYGYSLPTVPASYSSFPGYPITGYPNYSPISFEKPYANTGNVVSTSSESTSNVSKKEAIANPLPSIDYQYQFPYQYQPPSQPIQPWQSFYPVQMTPLGYPYPSQIPLYFLPPEVNIQATVSQPEKSGRYAQITITDKREADQDGNMKEQGADGTLKMPEETKL